MASPRSSAPSSPVCFDLNSPCADWAPAPLRIPCRKGKGDGEDANSIRVVKADSGRSLHSQQISTTRRSHQSSPPESATSPDTHHPRTTASRLGPLVSKFEVLGAVNNSDTHTSTQIRSHTAPSLTGVEAKKLGKQARAIPSPLSRRPG